MTDTPHVIENESGDWEVWLDGEIREAFHSEDLAHAEGKRLFEAQEAGDSK